MTTTIALAALLIVWLLPFNVMKRSGLGTLPKVVLSLIVGYGAAVVAFLAIFYLAFANGLETSASTTAIAMVSLGGLVIPPLAVWFARREASTRATAH